MKKTFLCTVSILLLCVMLIGCGGTPASTPSSAAPSEPESATDASVPISVSDSISSSEAVADSSDTPVPIYAGQIEDGTYAIEVSSSSSMFKILDAQLTVAGDEMSAVITLSGQGYGMLYMGTGEAALADTEDNNIPFVEDSEGMYVYEVPVEALDMELDVAAWSIRKEKWYDRVCIFQSDLIPADAITQ